MESLRPQNKAKRLGFGERWALGFGESREGRLWGPSSREWAHWGLGRLWDLGRDRVWPRLRSESPESGPRNTSKRLRPSQAGLLPTAGRQRLDSGLYTGGSPDQPGLANPE